MSDEQIPEERRWADLFRQERAPATTRRWENDSVAGTSPGRGGRWWARLLLAPLSAGGERRLRPLAAALVLPLLVLAVGGGLQLRAHFTGSTAGNGTPGDPPARESAAMAFDAARGVVVMFGGRGGVGGELFGDTWTWDGNGWSQQHPAHSPSPRSDAAMAFDPAHGVVVLYGGATQQARGTFPGADTWTWDGSDWHEVQTAHRPGLVSAAMVEDAARNQLLLVSSALTPVPMLLEQQAGTGGVPRQVPHATPAGSPPPDVPGGSAVASGGSATGVLVQPQAPPSPNLVAPAPLEPQIAVPVPADLQTWTWTGSDWSRLAPRTRPAGRPGLWSLAWDAASKRALMVAQRSPAGCAVAVEGTAKPGSVTAPPAATLPPAKALSPQPPAPAGPIEVPLAPPTVIQGAPSCALFSVGSPGSGRHCTECGLATQWTWDGSNWRSLDLGANVSFDGVRLVADPASGHAIAVSSTDTWTWNGSRWSPHRNPAGLAGRFSFQLAADTAHNQVVLFGGRAGELEAADTWTWDGRAWTHRAGPVLPPPPTPQLIMGSASGSSVGSSCLAGLPPYTVSSTPAGTVTIAIGVPAAKVQCTNVPPLTVRLLDSSGTLLQVTGNGLTVVHPLGTTLVWSNWCGARTVELSLEDVHSQERGPINADPACTDRSHPSVLEVGTAGIAIP